MLHSKYLMFIDILGFDKRATSIAVEKDIDVRNVRKTLIQVIGTKVESIEKRRLISGKKYGGSDDWLLVIDTLDNLFLCIDIILDHDTGYTKYESIPLEIAIGLGKYEEAENLKETNLIIEDSTITFLKTDIIRCYHETYKMHHKGQSPSSTFIVVTESVFNQMALYDRNIFQIINYKANDKETTFYVGQMKRVRQRGKVFDFLERIEQPHSRLYYRIDELFVPPVEYEDIRNILKAKRVVFITGPTGYGKTYTAIRLLWEYYNDGYQPKWIKGEEKEERIHVRTMLENIDAELQPQHIIYFEDPFGKTTYDQRESLERDIGTILRAIQKKEEAYAVITSREEIFKEFETHQISNVKLNEFERSLNIRRPSYDYSRRTEILLKWATENNCIWRNDDSLKTTVLQEITDSRKLPTPFSMRNFAYSTSDTKVENALLEQLVEKSIDAEKAFAREIESMSDDKIIFLALALIGHFHVKMIREVYEETIIGSGVQNAMEFMQVLDWFKDNKIQVANDEISFSHPSYVNAAQYILVKNGYPTRINRLIFIPLLRNLANKDEAVWYVARFIANNFRALDESVRNALLLDLSKKEKATEYVAQAVAANFKLIPSQLKELLFIFASNRYTASHVATALTNNYPSLPKDVGSELLRQLSRIQSVSGEELIVYLARTMLDNFSEITDEARNSLLLDLSKQEKVAPYIARVVTRHFRTLQNEVREGVLLNLAVAAQPRWGLAQAIAKNYRSFTNEVRDVLSHILSGTLSTAEDQSVTVDIAQVVAENFMALSNGVRNSLLRQLLEKEEAYWNVTRALTGNGSGQQKEYVFSKSIQKDDTWYLIKAIFDNYHKLPEDILRSALRLFEEKSVLMMTTEKLIQHYEVSSHQIVANIKARLES